MGAEHSRQSSWQGWVRGSAAAGTACCTGASAVLVAVRLWRHRQPAGLDLLRVAHAQQANQAGGIASLQAFAVPACSADADFSCFADLALTSPVDYYKAGQGSLMQVRLAAWWLPEVAGRVICVRGSKLGGYLLVALGM